MLQGAPTGPDVSGGVGARIRQARLDAELTRSQVATAAGVHPRTYRGWETGEAVPREGNLIGLARILEVRALWLADGTGPVEPKVR